MFRFNMLLSVVNIILLFGVQKSEILYVTKASNFTISCPFDSANAIVQWSGPPNLTTYNEISAVNPAVKDVAIIRSSENGKFNLIIYGFNESNEGIYQCLTSNKGKPVMHNFDVMLQSKKPTLSMNISPSKFVNEGTHVSFKYTSTAETTVAIETSSMWPNSLYDSSSNMFSYSPIYIIVGLGLLFTTIAFVGYLWYKSDNLKRRHEQSENRNSGQQGVNVAFNNIYGINENHQPIVHGAASASVVYSNFSRNEHDEALNTDQLPCRPSTSRIKQLDQQLVNQKTSELNYIEIDLDPVRQDRLFYIHGEDNRTEYSEIEIGVIGDPLQLGESETDDDNDIVDCVAINA